MTDPRIRRIAPADVPAAVALVHELAAYERESESCHLTEEQLIRALFGPDPKLFGHVAMDADGAVVGIALWFLNFSTWRGEHGIYLEDLFVRPDQRGSGLGRALLELVEDLAPADVTTYVLFTGAGSIDNQRMYKKAGFRLRPDRTAPPGAVVMTKRAARRISR